MDALMLKNVSKAYENFQLKNISFTLPEGTIMGLIGENGAGKSTIINCIMDLVKRDSGEITVLGQQMNKDNLALREDIGIVFDVSDFYDSFSMEHTEKILQDVYKSWDHETFQKYKQQFALPDKKRMKEFSRGMKMKTAVAIALSHKPRLLILDEATSMRSRGFSYLMRQQAVWIPSCGMKSWMYSWSLYRMSIILSSYPPISLPIWKRWLITLHLFIMESLYCLLLRMN